MSTRILGQDVATDGDLDGYQLHDTDLDAIAGLAPTDGDTLLRVSGAWLNRTMAQLKTALTLVKADVGLGSVDNTADTAKPVSTAQQTALDLKAPLASPTFTGTSTFATIVNQARRILIGTRTGAVTLTTSSSEYNTCDATTGAFNVTLPATTSAGLEITLKKIDVSLNAVTVLGTIDGGTNFALSTQHQWVTVVSTGVSGVWQIKNRSPHPRTLTVATATTATIDPATTDVGTLAALASAVTFAAPGPGIPTDGQTLLIRIKDNGSPRAITWNAIFRAMGVTLPTTTVLGKWLYITCVYNKGDSKWDVIEVRQEA